MIAEDEIYDLNGFAAYLAWKFWPRHKDFDDLRQQACLGMLEARARGLYDPAKGSFKTYAMSWARGSMLSYLSKRKLVRAYEALAVPIPDEDLDAEGDNRLQLVDDGVDGVEDLAAESECMERVARAFRKLPPRQQSMVRLRFEGDGLTLEQIGERHDLSRERVNQLLSDAFRRIRRSLEGEDYAAEMRLPPAYCIDFDQGPHKYFMTRDEAVAVAEKYRETGRRCLVREYLGTGYWDYVDDLNQDETP